MKVIAGVVLFLAVFAAFGQKKADVQILETKAIRDGDRITVDGRVKATNSRFNFVFPYYQREGTDINLTTTVRLLPDDD